MFDILDYRFCFVAICFSLRTVFEASYKEDRRAEYKPEDKKLESRLTWATAIGVAALYRISCLESICYSTRKCIQSRSVCISVGLEI